MGVRTSGNLLDKIDPLGWRLEIEAAATPEATSRALAETARDAIADADEINTRALGRTPPHRTIVDGREGAPLESVRPDGVIVAEFELLEEALQWIGEELVKASPVLTGQYSRSHVLLIDNVAAEPNAPIPALYDELVFVNTVPYARKIERGLSRQAPDGVYQVLAGAASRRFGNIARIRFGYKALDFGGISAWAATTAMEVRSRTGAKRDEWLKRQPAIFITPHR